MGHIKLLPDALINKIAAGEVIERPASIVKELIENSIDAYASKIVIEIEDGGKKLIRIADNGIGMDSDDCLKVFQRHATSKIFDEIDLFSISTMGFRGEALASISAVAEVEIKAKLKDQNFATKVSCIGGLMSKPEKSSLNEGTLIQVKNLFFNIPARQKFLKSDSTEFSHILNLVTEFALGYPHISFKLIHNTKKILEVLKTDDLQQRIVEILGFDVGSNLLNVDYFGVDPKVTGFVGKPAIARTSKQSQYLFVNGRPVKDNMISHAVFDAFFSTLPDKKFPMFVLFIEINPDEVDVNIHPRKLEVRFAYKNMIYSIVKNSVQAALEKDHIVPEITGKIKSYWNSENIYKDKIENKIPANNQIKNSFQESYKLNSSRIQNAINFSENFLNNSKNFENENLEQTSKNDIKVLGQIKKSYILACDNEGIFIIDQHAAHERILYQKLISDSQKSELEKQLLLTPVSIELSIPEIEILKNNLDRFENIGFEIEEFGGSSFQISAVPAKLKNTNIAEIVKGVIDDIADGRWSQKIQEPEHELICYTACRSAIKFGQSLAMAEMQALITDLETQTQKSTCPHGRPTMIRLSFAELEKRFGRK